MRLLTFLSILIVMASCATLPSQNILQPLWKTHKDTVSQIDIWQLNGRIVVSDADSAWNARVIWQQRPQTYQLVFNSPVGGAMRLIGTEHQVVMNTADNKTYTADTPEQLAKQVLKVEVPVQYLHAWIRGIPAPTQKKLEYVLNKHGQLSRLEQAGWTVDFKRYASVDGIYLPDKLFLQKQDYRVKIVVNKWKPNNL